jgi:serine/threonine protein phosphatase PrpC
MIRATSGVTTHVGEVASEIAVRILQEVYTDPKVRVSSPGLLADAISTANTAIFMEAMHDSSKTGMGTTLTGLAVTNGPDNQIVVANVGDSRTYLWRHGELRQVTKDHSHVQTLVDRGAITRAEARVHFQRNIVLRAMGIESWVDIDTFPMTVEDGDRFIMCSDGLVDEADDDEIEAEIRLSVSVQDLADRLVDLANRNGGRDNITVVVVDFAVVENEEVVASEPELQVIADDFDATSTAATITEEIAVITPAIAIDDIAPPRPSRWFTVATYAMWLASAAITATVIISAITSSQ